MDRVIRWVPPFDSTSTEVIYETATRMNSASFSEDMEHPVRQRAKWPDHALLRGIPQ